jgi:hypothetical protein
VEWSRAIPTDHPRAFDTQVGRCLLTVGEVDAPVVRSRSRENRRTSFSTASGIQAPATHPVVQYCPGFEMGVPPVEVREPGTAVSGDAAK